VAQRDEEEICEEAGSRTTEAWRVLDVGAGLGEDRRLGSGSQSGRHGEEELRWPSVAGRHGDMGEDDGLA
jgi:hypothetical protein